MTDCQWIEPGTGEECTEEAMLNNSFCAEHQEQYVKMREAQYHSDGRGGVKDDKEIDFSKFKRKPSENAFVTKPTKSTKENIQDHTSVPRKKWSRLPHEEIRQDYLSGMSIADLVKKYNTSKGSIDPILKKEPSIVRASGVHHGKPSGGQVKQRKKRRGKYETIPEKDYVVVVTTKFCKYCKQEIKE